MAKIARFYSFDGENLILVPGTDPAQIRADAAGELDDDEEITTPLEDVQVEWWRTSPCHPNSCTEGPHRTHYHPTRGRSRGGFQAAALNIGFREETRG